MMNRTLLLGKQLFDIKMTSLYLTEAPLVAV